MLFRSIAFGPYRGQYSRITDPSRMRYWENYNASEGFFAVQSRPGCPAMGLLMNAEVFYEFIPVDDPDASPLPAWEVTPGQVCELVITSSNGLWRYRLGDTVRIEPQGEDGGVEITIAGRTKCFINAFGEELMVHNAEAAMARAAAMTGAEVADYTAAPVYAGDNTRGRHQWLIEFTRRPDDIGRFAGLLDRRLQELNSDYEAKRYKDITLQHLEIVEARPNLFNDWLKLKGKLGGQHKIPRLSNSRDIMEQMMTLNEQSKA